MRVDGTLGERGKGSMSVDGTPGSREFSVGGWGVVVLSTISPEQYSVKH